MASTASTRKDTHSGSWYDSDASALESQLKFALEAVDRDPTYSLKYIISPHAGYFYSLKTAAHCYKLIDTSTTKRAFILGPSHHLHIRGCGIDEFTALDTPLGLLDVDTSTMTSLSKNQGFSLISKYDSQKEHSIEMQLPILRYVSKSIKVVPIMVGFLDDKLTDQISAALLPYFLDEANLFIISSDFCHFGERFNFTKTGYEDSGMDLHRCIEMLDMEAIRRITSHDLSGFKSNLESTANTICGHYPIELLLKLISSAPLKIQSNLLSYTQSSQAKSARDSSVSYAAIAGTVL